jgi:DNA-binding LacI/PurR family transcriptional regulator
MTVTMEDVARHAAVSTATVSRVINTPNRVNIETRVRVQEAILALNYRVNVTARNLRTRRTQNIAVVVPHLKNPLITDILEALERAALAEGYTTQLCLTYGEI